MTALIKSQLLTAFVMTCCGITAAIVYDVFSLFIKRFLRRRRAAAIAVRLAGYCVIGIITSDFMMYCQNGKITFSGAFFMLAGILLWRRYFYDILNSADEKVEEHEQKRTKTQRV